jgi:hypothetical protein
MPQKWSRPRSLGELFNQSYDHTKRVMKQAGYVWDGSNYVAAKGDSSGVAAIEQEGAGAVGDGTTTVTTAGTRVQLADNSCRRVWVQANSANTGVMVVGGSTVVAAEATRQGTALWPTQGAWFNVSNTNLLYVDSTVNGEKIHWYYEN